jgi:hypothetical protein
MPKIGVAALAKVEWCRIGRRKAVTIEIHGELWWKETFQSLTLQLNET